MPRVCVFCRDAKPRVCVLVETGCLASVFYSLSRLNKVHLYLNSPLQNKFCTPRAKLQNKFCTPRAKLQNKFCTPIAPLQNKFFTKIKFVLHSIGKRYSRDAMPRVCVFVSLRCLASVFLFLCDASRLCFL